MKTLIKPIVILLAGCLILVSCKEEKKDACEDTKAAAKNLTLKATVVVNSNTGVPIAGELVTLRMERNACGANEASYVNNFEGNTDTLGMFSSTYVSMVLDNTLDEAFITSTAPDLPAVKNWSNATIYYHEFSDGDTIEETLTINDDK
ncbi:MAG: hypothetical protein KKA81_08950 [Bacteroidetes bacterium]|nr:hypothetical protein [Bacteroidota bacterium]